jgi:hypothetical protein
MSPRFLFFLSTTHWHRGVVCAAGNGSTQIRPVERRVG